MTGEVPVKYERLYSEKRGMDPGKSCGHYTFESAHNTLATNKFTNQVRVRCEVKAFLVGEL